MTPTPVSTLITFKVLTGVGVTKRTVLTLLKVYLPTVLTLLKVYLPTVLTPTLRFTSLTADLFCFIKFRNCEKIFPAIARSPT
eukprot:COSAG05_NODE_137_length_16843_cov_121.090779_14_plen_83_part_00